MTIHHTESAFKHGISAKRSAYVVRNPIADFVLPADSAHPSARRGFLGFDSTGVPLEVFAVLMQDGALLVIHAMPMRRQFNAYLKEHT